MAAAVKPEEHKKGSFVVREGEPGDKLYVILSGRLEVRRDYAPQEIRLQRNYRSSGTIVAAAAQVIAASDPAAAIVRAMQERITIHAAPT